MNQAKEQILEDSKTLSSEFLSPCLSGTFFDQETLTRLSTLVLIGKITPEIIHDINNHLTGILGYSELLSMKKIEDENIKKGLKNISISAEKCKLLLGDILALSRPEPSIQFGDVNEIIERTIELRKCTFRHQQIEVSLDLESKIPTLAVDGIKLQKILLIIIFKAEEALKKQIEGKNLVFKTRFDFLDQSVSISVSANLYGISIDEGKHGLEPMPGNVSLDMETVFQFKEAENWIQEIGGSMLIEHRKEEGLVFRVILPAKG